MLDKSKDPLKKINVRSDQQFVDDWLYDFTKGVVQSGPFSRMRLSRETAWSHTALSPMLIGCFEQELHADLEMEITRLNKMEAPTIVNVGCAEGYYAVGLARRVPKAKVYAVDVDDEALRITATNAADNGVNVVFQADASEYFSAPDFIFMDCEGHEAAYLDLETFPALAKAGIILEIHNLHLQDRTQDLIERRFQSTHQIKEIFEGGRNPNVDFFCDMPSAVRWIAVCENRPCIMNWFVMRSWMRGDN